jgi:hypothetical protein
VIRVVRGALLAVLLLAPVASAQPPDPRVAEALRVEWQPSTERPGIEGFVYNDSPYRIGLVRLQIMSREPGRAPTPSLAWLYGNVPARGRWPFSVRVPRTREVVSVAIESFHLIAREPAAESP